MGSPSTDARLSSLADVLADEAAVTGLRTASTTSFAAASEYWRVPLEAGHLTPRMCELVLLAMHATSTALNVDGVRRHIERARSTGATEEDIVDVLFTITAVANHALYFSVPILEEELQAAGVGNTPEADPTGDYAPAKLEFLKVRGFWNADREKFARLMPNYFRALHTMSVDSWKNGSLTAKEREFVCIAIDCTVTHNYEPGLRVHIRNAIGHGATREEILQIFQLAGLLGLEGYIIGARALFGAPVAKQ